MNLAQQIQVDERDGPSAPWGQHALVLRFAGVRFVLNGLTERQQQSLHRRYRCDRRDGDSEDEAVTTQIGRLPHLRQDPGAYTKSGFYCPHITRRADHLEIEGYGFLARLALGPTMNGALWAADGDLLTRPLVIENYLRIVAAYMSLTKGGLLLHSAGVVVDGQAYLFLGRSGAGKTTISRLALASGMGVLSDDINIVLPSGKGGFRVGAVPFAGELGNSRLVRDGDYPLGGVFWLEKGMRLDTAPMSLSVQLARIYACCPVVNMDAQLMDGILAAGTQLLTAQPLRYLHFGIDEAFCAIFGRIRKAAR